MKLFRDYELRTIFTNIEDKLKRYIKDFSNDEIMANSLEILAENCYQKFFIEPIIIFEENYSKRNMTQGSFKKYIEPIWRDYNNCEYIDVEGIKIEFHFPFSGECDLFKCRASTYSLSPYPQVSICANEVIFEYSYTYDESQKEGFKDIVDKRLKGELNSINRGLSYVNNDVNSFNALLKSKSMSLLAERKKEVQQFYSLTKMFEVPLKKDKTLEKVIEIKREIAPISHKYSNEEYYCIRNEEYNDIIKLIKNTCCTVERTPVTYKNLGEEDLRNIILTGLNGIYEGGASGETFRNKGKTDICIEKENRAAFVAECKIWKGSVALKSAIEQLDGYLTWRDCKTALIFFVRNKNFFKILESAEIALKEIDNIKSFKVVEKNEFECQYYSKSNIGQLIIIRVMLFNLYSE